MIDLLQTIFWAIVAIGILVTVHEFGHFWVARRLGVKVVRFSVGFGKSLWKRTAADGVEYIVAAIPLGGYVKMVDEREGDVDEADLPRAFNRQSLAVRSAIVVAGPLFNFLFAIFAYWAVFVAGENGMKPLLDTPPEESVAALAGVRAGDQIVAINAEKTPTWERVLMRLVKTAIDREDAVLSLQNRDGGVSEVVFDSESLSVLTTDQAGPDALGLVQEIPSIPAVIDHVESGKAGDHAGFQSGDHILSADGIGVENWEMWRQIVRAHPQDEIEVAIDRDGLRLSMIVIPERAVSGEDEYGFVGLGPAIPDGLYDDYRAVNVYAPLPALGKAFRETWDMSMMTLKVIGGMLTGSMSVNNIGGPITIAKAAGNTAEVGMSVFVKFLAMLSVTIAVLNLLPIPILDGGHLFFYLVEAVKGSPVSDELQLRAQNIGIIILAGIMFLALYVDFNRLLGG